MLGGDFLSSVGTGLTLPFLLIYLSRVRGLDLSVAGLAVSAIPLASFVGNPLGGSLSDRHGARNTLIFGLLVSAAGAGSIALVHQTWQAFAAAGLAGLGVSVTWPAQDALLAQLVPAEQRSGVFSVRNGTMNAGFGAGGLMAAAIADISSSGSFVVLYLLDAASFLAFVPVLLRLPNRPPALAPEATDTVAVPGPGGYRQVLQDRMFVRLWILTALVVTVSYGQFAAGFPAYATRPGGVSPGTIGLAFAANTFTVVGAQLFVLRRLRGWRRTAALRLACAGFAAAWGLTLIGGQLGGGPVALSTFAAAMAVFALAETFLAPTLPAMVNDLASDELRGRYNGAATLAWTTGFFTGPAVAGFALEAGAGTVLFLSLIAGCGLVGLGSRRLERHLPEEANLVGV